MSVGQGFWYLAQLEVFGGRPMLESTKLLARRGLRSICPRKDMVETPASDLVLIFRLRSSHVRQSLTPSRRTLRNKVEV